MGKAFRRLKRFVVGASLLAVTAIEANKVIPMMLNSETRKLTTEEIKLGKEIFGDRIDYEKVTIHNGTKGILSTINERAITNGNDIYINAKNDDWKNTDPVLIAHELEHVDQYKNTNIFQKAAIFFDMAATFIKSGGSYNKTYENAFNNKNFKENNIEQQGIVVEKYAESLLAFQAESEKLTHPEQMKDGKEKQEVYVIDQYRNLRELSKYVDNALPLPSMQDVENKMATTTFEFENNIKDIKEAQKLYPVPAAPQEYAVVTNKQQNKL